MKNCESNVVSIIRQIAQEEGMKLSSYSDDWAFRLEKNGKVCFIVGYQFPLNLSSAKEICQDKVLTSEILYESGIPVSRHFLLPDNDLKVYTGAPDSFAAAGDALLKHGRLVIKDNFGTGGNRVYLVGTEEELKEALGAVFAKSTAACYSEVLDIRNEYRAVMLDGEAVLIIRKERMSLLGDGIHTVLELAEKEPAKYAFAVSLKAPDRNRIPAEGETVFLNWRHNLGQGARGVIETDTAISDRVKKLAKDAAACIGIRFASVDIVDAGKGFMVLEMNGGVMLEHFSGQSPENFDLAKEIYREAILKYFSSEEQK